MEIRLIQSHIEAQLLCIERQLFCTELGHIGLIQSYIKTSPYHSDRRLPSAFREAGILLSRLISSLASLGVRQISDNLGPLLHCGRYL